MAVESVVKAAKTSGDDEEEAAEAAMLGTHQYLPSNFKKSRHLPVGPCVPMLGFFLRSCLSLLPKVLISFYPATFQIL